eukprot:gnl/TRDRNA2_/TRDRNA2_145551_c1_seq2.p1 gnl/TRDRNA2_/TRDRNA2_145551_c1~~gnl/TRDRNA2_/TRDRNA2_145551_c1_seq2.p1  ORF type:complete len:133 (+),score=6.27 gnl/TRDRNA2_/TRDRNA2_145551_c1_seq2:83-481(+)
MPTREQLLRDMFASEMHQVFTAPTGADSQGEDMEPSAQLVSARTSSACYIQQVPGLARVLSREPSALSVPHMTSAPLDGISYLHEPSIPTTAGWRRWSWGESRTRTAPLIEEAEDSCRGSTSSSWWRRRLSQ